MTAMTLSPVSKVTGLAAPPKTPFSTLTPASVLLTVTVAWAGQYSLGRKCRVRSSTQYQEPVTAGDEVTCRARSTTARAALVLHRGAERGGDRLADAVRAGVRAEGDVQQVVGRPGVEPDGVPPLGAVAVLGAHPDGVVGACGEWAGAVPLGTVGD